MDHNELMNRFKYHPAKDVVTQRAHETIRDMCKGVAVTLNAGLMEGREKALAITKLEEVMFWANASIARQGGGGDGRG
jgi:hypothetical protein